MAYFLFLQLKAIHLNYILMFLHLRNLHQHETERLHLDHIFYHLLHLLRLLFEILNLSLVMICLEIQLDFHLLLLLPL
jgi:hypothetical protein